MQIKLIYDILLIAHTQGWSIRSPFKNHNLGNLVDDNYVLTPIAMES